MVEKGHSRDRNIMTEKNTMFCKRRAFTVIINVLAKPFTKTSANLSHKGTSAHKHHGILKRGPESLRVDKWDNVSMEYNVTL